MRFLLVKCYLMLVSQRDEPKDQTVSLISQTLETETDQSDTSFCKMITVRLRGKLHLG